MDPFEGLVLEPASLHRYLYATVDPVDHADPTGLFATSLHSMILDRAFKGISAVSPDDIRTFKIISARQDDLFMGGQGKELAYQHAMRGPSQTIGDARALYERFIEDNLTDAIRLELVGGHARGMEYLGASFHAIADNASPAHNGFQVWDPFNPFLVAGHIKAEQNPPQWAVDQAIKDVRSHYNRFRGELRPRLTLSSSPLAGFPDFAGALVSFAAFTGFF